MKIGQLPEENEMYDLADLFKCFGDSTRLKIMFVLLKGEVCVNDIAETLNMTQSAVSHQLQYLKQNKLISSRRDGKQMIYSLADDHVGSILRIGLEHIEEP